MQLTSRCIVKMVPDCSREDITIPDGFKVDRFIVPAGDHDSVYAVYGFVFAWLPINSLAHSQVEWLCATMILSFLDGFGGGTHLSDIFFGGVNERVDHLALISIAIHLLHLLITVSVVSSVHLWVHVLLEKCFISSGNLFEKSTGYA